MRATVRVLDSYNLIADIEGEKGSGKMIELFQLSQDSGRDLLLTTVNWGGVCYITLREAGLSEGGRGRPPDFHPSHSDHSCRPGAG